MEVNIVEDTFDLLIGSTFGLWDAIRGVDEERRINAAIKKAFEPVAITTATEDTTTVLDRIDLANPPKPLDNYIDKRLKAGLEKARRELTNSERKNYSGDTKIQVSTPTKRGQSSKKVHFEPSSKAHGKVAKKKKGDGKANAKGNAKAKPSSHPTKPKPTDKQGSKGKVKSGYQGGPKSRGSKKGTERR